VTEANIQGEQKEAIMETLSATTGLQREALRLVEVHTYSTLKIDGLPTKARGQPITGSDVLTGLHGSRKRN
jgi:hypothetical protein